ncbi:hypothetical protein PR048_025924 [Dryococelus australis]|uniref:Uncharacterized protein n=1 Tax=Dryococelus australis TaxID=614101 RepID=A0ABQ9GJX8_9NEOP|nr:hypothetical protein PR048_025924 [Dryococelus australis]
MRVIEASMEQRRNEGTGEAGDPRENPPTNDIVSGRGGRAVSPLASHQGGSIPGRVIGFSQEGILPDDALGRRVFSGISPFLPPFHSGAAPNSPHYTLIGSQDIDI